MLPTRRIAARSARTIRPTRRYVGTGEKVGDKVHHFAGESVEHGHHHAGPANESLGTQFYFALALIPACAGLYAFAQPSKDGTGSSLTRMIDSYNGYREKWAARNTLHTAMIEQAAFDSNLFKNAAPSRHVDLRFPEIFNTGSPYNVAAGQTADLSKLVAHYEKVNADAEDAKAKKLAVTKQ